MIASPSSLNHCVVMCSGFSIRPTMATVGVGINRAGRVLVVERAVAAGDGRVEGAAGIGQAAHAFLELPEQLGVVRVARS